jgi:16S rRNA (cytosine967-C5)-methyltransferase
MARLQENMERLGLPVRTVQADACTWQPDTPLDAILLDAPCSATGTARRHPDVLWVKRPRDLTALTAAQDRLLAAARDMLRPGGRLVYAVCSLQEEEGPARARAAQAMGLVPSPFTPEELAVLPEALTPEGWLRTHPGLWPELGGMDGFFAARFIRPA